ncbi:MAG: hypothetical protein FWD76_05335 [Firmicutes bacterium]|nr:hypothetical protein [Bacillota bacterium]
MHKKDQVVEQCQRNHPQEEFTFLCENGVSKNAFVRFQWRQDQALIGKQCRGLVEGFGMSVCLRMQNKGDKHPLQKVIHKQGYDLVANEHYTHFCKQNTKGYWKCALCSHHQGATMLECLHPSVIFESLSMSGARKTTFAKQKIGLPCQDAVRSFVFQRKVIGCTKKTKREVLGAESKNMYGVS